MVEMYKRCIKCNVVYIYQASGHWKQDYPHEYSDREYCPDCKKIIVDALKKVKVRVQEIWDQPDDMNLGQLLAVQKIQHDESVSTGGIFCRRIFPCLMDMKTGESEHRGEVQHNGKTYRYCYWPGKETKGEVTVRMEKDLKTGVIQPWRDI